SPNDNLDAAQRGDLSIQLSAGNADILLHVLRDIARHTPGQHADSLTYRWLLQPSRPSGTHRNLMGFKDGIANPDTACLSPFGCQRSRGSRRAAYDLQNME